MEENIPQHTRYKWTAKKPSKKIRKKHHVFRPIMSHIKIITTCTNQISKSNCRVKSTLYFLQGSSLRFHNVTRYVQGCKDTNGCKSQVHCADSKLVYNAQEIETNEEIWDLYQMKPSSHKHFTDYISFPIKHVQMIYKYRRVYAQ